MKIWRLEFTFRKPLRCAACGKLIRDEKDAYARYSSLGVKIDHYHNDCPFSYETAE